MKIVATDNYDRSGERPGSDEFVVAENVNGPFALALVERYGEIYLLRLVEDGEIYLLRLVPDDYKLATFLP